MYLKSVLHMGWLMVHFRNGAALVECLRTGRPCEELVLWDGTRISHPPGRGGLLEAVQETWRERVYTDGFYTPGDGEVVVDVGANVGLFAILVARQNPRCRVIALEPFAENFRYLRDNIARACPGNASCHQLALGSSFGSGHMQTVGSRSLDHVLQLQNASAGGPDTQVRSAVVDGAAGSETISVIPLSGIFELAGAPEIDFLKVDIEGSERDVFAAVAPDVLRRIKRIAMEYHDHIAPGTLEVLRRVLVATHVLTVRSSHAHAGGTLMARRRAAEK